MVARNSLFEDTGILSMFDMMGIPTLPANIASYTPNQKALLYNELLGAGYNDAQIRQAAEMQVGTQADADWSYLQNLATQVNKPKAVLFGDSISEYVGYNPDGTPDTRYGNSVADVLSQNLGIPIQNLATGGETSNEALQGSSKTGQDFATYIQANKPEYAIIRFGAADAIKNDDPQTTLNSVQQMVDIAKAYGTTPVIVGVSELYGAQNSKTGNIAGYIDPAAEQRATAINDGLKSIAEQNGLSFTDVRSAVAAPQGSLLDGVHATGDFGKAMADAISSSIVNTGAIQGVQPTQEIVQQAQTLPSNAVVAPSETVQAQANPGYSSMNVTQGNTLYGPTQDELQNTLANLSATSTAANEKYGSDPLFNVLKNGIITAAGIGLLGPAGAGLPSWGAAAATTGLNTAAQGGSLEDSLKAAALSGLGAYAGGALNNYLGGLGNDAAFAAADAAQLAEQGLNASAIAQNLSTYVDPSIANALGQQAATQFASGEGVSISDLRNTATGGNPFVTPKDQVVTQGGTIVPSLPDAVEITGSRFPTLPALEATGGLLGSVIPSAVSSILPAGIENASPLEKAKAYNDARASGLSDQQVRIEAERVLGPQTDADWSYLQTLASLSSAVVPSVPTSTVTPTTAVATPTNPQVEITGTKDTGGLNTSILDLVGLGSYLTPAVTTPTATTPSVTTPTETVTVEDTGIKYTPLNPGGLLGSFTLNPVMPPAYVPPAPKVSVDPERPDREQVTVTGTTMPPGSVLDTLGGVFTPTVIPTVPPAVPTAPTTPTTPTTPDQVTVTDTKITDPGVLDTVGSVVLPGLVGVPTAPTTTIPTGTPPTTDDKTTTPDITDLIKTLLPLVGTGVLSSVTNTGTTPTVVPPSTVPTYDQDYFNRIQQYYNAYMPQMPRDVATPLQQWYTQNTGV